MADWSILSIVVHISAIGHHALVYTSLLIVCSTPNLNDYGIKTRINLDKWFWGGKARGAYMNR